MAEVKLDGSFNHLCNINNNTYLLNKSGLKRTDCDITSSVKFNFGQKQVHLIGELYYNEGKRGDLYGLLSHRDSNSLHFTPHDIVSYDGSIKTNLDLLTRLEMLNELWPKGHEHYRIVNNHKEVSDYFNDVTSRGYEGIVIKNFTSKLVFGPCSWVKVKYKDMSAYTVVFIDAIKERIEVLVPDGNGCVNNVVVKVMNKDKQKLSIGDQVDVEHQGTLSGGGLRHPVYKGQA